MGKALSYYRKAVERRDAEGMYQLALCYLEGKAVAADPEAARELCRQALDSEDLRDQEDTALERKLQALMARLEG